MKTDKSCLLEGTKKRQNLICFIHTQSSLHYFPENDITNYDLLLNLERPKMNEKLECHPVLFYIIFINWIQKISELQKAAF